MKNPIFRLSASRVVVGLGAVLLSVHAIADEVTPTESEARIF